MPEDVVGLARDHLVHEEAAKHAVALSLDKVLDRALPRVPDKVLVTHVVDIAVVEGHKPYTRWVKWVVFGGDHFLDDGASIEHPTVWAVGIQPAASKTKI